MARDAHDPGPLPASDLGLPGERLTPWGQDQEPADLAPPPGFRDLPEYPSAEANPDSPAASSPASGGSDAAPPGASPTITVPRGKAAAYRKIMQAGFKALGGLINSVIAAGPEDESFLPDSDDLDTVGPPLGRVAARHVPLGKATENMTDVEDLGMAAIGLIAWALKGAGSWWEARRAKTRLPAGTAVQPEDTNPGARA